MKIIEDEGFCTCCGRHTEYRAGEENFSLIKKNLESYKNYKDIFVDECPSCGFISTDITNEEGVLYGGVKDTYEFKQLFSYAYLNGLDEDLYENHSADIPANYYEAYSLVCLAEKDYEKFIRVLNKAIELKIIMARKYRRSQHELGGEEDNDDDYDELDRLIKESIDSNRKQIDYYYSMIENKNVFVKLVYIENLIGLGDMAKAIYEYEMIDKKVKLNGDLKEYFTKALKI